MQRWIQQMALPLLGVAIASVSAGSETNAPWALPSITHIATTNPAVWPPPPPPEPHRAALQELTAVSTNPPGSSQLPDLPRIFGLEPDKLPEGVDAEARAERVRVTELLKVTDAQLRQGDGEAAIARLQAELSTVSNKTSRAFMLNRMGAYEFRLQRYTEAVDHIRQANQLDPASPPHIINLAATLLNVGKVDEGLALLNTLDPGLLRNANLQFSLHFNLACAYSLKGNVTEAVNHVREAARASPASALASFGDPQLDPIRHDPAFERIQRALDQQAAAPGM